MTPCAPPRIPVLADVVRSLGYKPDLTWWWLSFLADDGEKLGIAIVPLPPPIIEQARSDGEDVTGEAVAAAWDYGCNPGGHVGVAQLPPEDAEWYLSELAAGTFYTVEKLRAAHERMGAS